MTWKQYIPPVIPSLENESPENAKRFTDICITHLIMHRESWIKEKMKELGIDNQQKAIEFVITDFDYPLHIGQDCDKTSLNKYCGKACYEIDLDYWNTSEETLMTYILNKKLKNQNGFGDCLTGDTKIITVRDNRYNIETLNDLRKYGWRGVKVLSYDFNTNSWAFEPITNFYDRGVKDTWEVTLRNGTSFRVADKHKMYAIRHSSKIPEGWFELMYFNEFKDRWDGVKNKRYYQLPLAKKIPALGTVDADRGELYIEGHYVAEGWKERGHVATSGDINRVKQLCDELNIPYRLSRNKNGVAELYFRKSYLKERLENMGSNAFDKHFLDDRLSLSEEGIRALLDGYIDGDGYRNPKRILRSGKRQDTVEVIYNTSSDKLAEQLSFMTRILGKYFYKWYQINHQGVGKRPIWRIYVYRKTRTWKNITPYLANMSVKSIEYQGKERVYDIEVAGTHNFVLADSGILVHNCEDMSILVTSLLRLLGADSWEMLGAVYRGSTLLGGHGFNISRLSDGKYHLIEATLSEPPEYPDEYPVVDITKNSWTIGNITYKADIRFNNLEYYEWSDGDMKFDKYVKLRRRDKETYRKYRAIQEAYGISVKPLKKRGLLSRLRWRK